MNAGVGRLRRAAATALAGVLVAGCAHPGHRAAPLCAPDAGATLAERDPRAYLEQVVERCRQLEQYTMIFTRTERRGLFQQLEGPERIRVWFRRSPFSVRMKWLDEDIKYGESTYVQGRYGEQVRFVTRWWSPPLKPPPQINAFDVRMPVLLGEARRPLTEFGLEKMMDRIWVAVERAGDRVQIDYRGVEPLRPGGPLVHRFDLTFDPGMVNFPRQTLSTYVDSGLPAGLMLVRADGTLDSDYLYEEIDTRVALTDDDFLLTVEQPGTATQPASAEAPEP